MRRVMGSQVNRLWEPAAASMGMATHAVSMDTDSAHRRSMMRVGAGWTDGWKVRVSGGGGAASVHQESKIQRFSERPGLYVALLCRSQGKGLGRVEGSSRAMVEAGCIHHITRCVT